jgi:hypothetical protein
MEIRRRYSWRQNYLHRLEHSRRRLMILRCITLAGSRCLRGWETRSVHALAMCWRGAVLRHSCRRCWLSGYPVGDMKKVWKGFKGID